MPFHISNKSSTMDFWITCSCYKV